MKIFSFLVFVLLVSPTSYAQQVISVGTFGADFRSPQGAIDSISRRLNPPSDTNRYVISLQPGRYTITRTLQMLPYVDLKGSGIDNTVIEGSINGPTFGVVNASSYSKISDLSVENNWTKSTAVAISVIKTNSTELVGVKAIAVAPADNTSAWKHALRIDKSRGVRLVDFLASSSTRGTQSACFGAWISDSGVYFKNSKLIAGTPTSNGSIINPNPNCGIAIGLYAQKSSTVTFLKGESIASGSINSISASFSSERIGQSVQAKLYSSTLNGHLIAGFPSDRGRSVVVIRDSVFDGSVFRGNPTCINTETPEGRELGSDCRLVFRRRF